ncbi:MAG: hypothetical protein NXI16_14640 [Alphaproteobacteria bacterium]|nr:hypothetical protein [Alphaproteobacteria bacterium]
MDIISLALSGLLFVWPLWKIYERVGMKPYYALLALLPGVGLLLALLPLAVSAWPAYGETEPPK